VWFIGLSRKLGLTVGLNGSNPSADVNVTTLGSVPNEVAGYLSGKVPAFMNIPPNTIQPNSVVIPFADLPPLTNVVGNYFMTTIAMIQQHRDTVQAVVNAMTDATAVYLVKSPKKSKQAVQSDLLANGTTTSVFEYVYEQARLDWHTPYPTLSAFNQSLAVYNIPVKTPFTVNYRTFVNQQFAKNAYATLHLKLP
jgi:hypothetical protein